MSATLTIRKKSAKTWLHVPSDQSSFIISKFYFSIDGDYFRIVEQGESKRNAYIYSSITVIDDTTNTDYGVQGSVSELSELLETLLYPAFNFSSEGATGDLESVTANGATTTHAMFVTDGNNTTGMTPTTFDVTDVDGRSVSLQADGLRMATTAGGANVGHVKSDNLNADRTHQLPNANGTFAVSITISGVTYTAGTAGNIFVS